MCQLNQTRKWLTHLRVGNQQKNNLYTLYTLDILAEPELLQDGNEVGHATDQPTLLRLFDQSVNAVLNRFTDVHLVRVSGARWAPTGFNSVIVFGHKSSTIFTETHLWFK